MNAPRSHIAPEFFDATPLAWPFEGIQPQSYSFIMADPAWPFALRSKRGQAKSAEAQYETMSFDDINALPVGDLAREHCLLWLWGTWPLLPRVSNTLTTWGFDYVTGGAWNKKMWGTGYVMRSVCEPFLIGKKGMPKVDGRSIPNLITELRRQHSQKPELAYQMAEKMMPNAKRIELFSRTDREGWDVWGNQTGMLNESEPLPLPEVRMTKQVRVKG